MNLVYSHLGTILAEFDALRGIIRKKSTTPINLSVFRQLDGKFECMNLHGWFELTFYSPDGYIGTFGNNAVPEGRKLAEGSIGQEMGMRSSGCECPPIGTFSSVWRGHGQPNSHNRLSLEILKHREKADAYELFWKSGNTIEFYGVGNLLNGNRLVGWYTMTDSDPLDS